MNICTLYWGGERRVPVGYGFVQYNFEGGKGGRGVERVRFGIHVHYIMCLYVIMCVWMGASGRGFCAISNLQGRKGDGVWKDFEYQCMA